MKNWLICAGLLQAILMGSLNAQTDKDAWVQKEAEREWKDWVSAKFKSIDSKLDGQEDSGDAMNWPDWLTISGDLRLRYEQIKREGSKRRHRGRMRARVALDTKVNEEVKVGIGLASGSDDPVSTNETFDGGASTKAINLDKAYAEYKPSWFKGLKAVGGKMSNPFEKIKSRDLMWDGDLNPEGVALKYAKEVAEGIEAFINGTWWWLEENSSSADTHFSGVQGGLKATVGGVKTTVGAGYVMYNNIKGSPTLYDDTDGFGNSTTLVGAVETYDNKYNICEVFGDVSFKAGDLPITIYGHMIDNTEVRRDQKAYLAGIHFGKAKKPGEWEAGWNFRRLEKDAVVGAFTDSDFGGGGTDAKGSKFMAAYQIAEGVKTAATYFMNEVGIASGSPADYDRIQLDIIFDF